MGSRLTKGLVVGAALLGLAACATARAPSRPVDPRSRESGPTSRAQARRPADARPAAATPDPRHRQYYDQRKRRYYFYDPARQRYFWEDGQPKG